MSETTELDQKLEVAIIGGGITGLYCALRCRGAGKVAVFERMGEFGGRICSKTYGVDQPEFIAEFGPMRIEPDQQRLLQELLKELKIVGKQDTTSDAAARLTDFPAYASPPSLNEPTFLLSGDESTQATPLDLLQLAFVRIMGRLAVVSDAPPPQAKALDNCIANGQHELMLAAATRQTTWKGAFGRWVNRLDEMDYHLITAYAAFEYEDGDRVPLWTMGFWNLMTEVLSHQAVSKLRTQGSFYHLLDENPNAAEWLIFWLRGLKSTNKLHGIDRGMSHLIHLMKGQLEKQPNILRKKALLRSLKPEGDHIRLSFFGHSDVLAEHVILSVPKSPLEKIVAASTPYFPEPVQKHIDGVFPFPMIKLFFIVRKRWWGDDRAANYKATSIPTRELHYFPSRDEKSKRGMIMIYADRPSSTFWANYVSQPGHQDDVEWKSVNWADLKSKAGSPTDTLEDAVQTRRLLRRLAQYVRENAHESFREDEIEHIGIRDWGREPFGGANHAWRPERKPWEELQALSSFSLCDPNSSKEQRARVHICGEAYSDYHGFIEGSLRSAAHVLHKIDPSHQTQTPWSCDCSDCIKTVRDYTAEAGEG
jgi:monoamine oxidase